MTTTSATRLETAHPAQPVSSRAQAAWSAVVGFDGSDPSRAALDFAAELVRGRTGHLEVVYVAHLPASVGLSAPAVQGMREGFDVIATELFGTVQAVLDDQKARWHFERRDGSVADELLAAARQLRHQHGPDSIVVIVVGSAEHLRHHVIGSTAAALTHEREFPLLVVPTSTLPSGPSADNRDTTAGYHAARPTRNGDDLVERTTAERVLGRVGFSRDDIAEVLRPIRFPAPLSVVMLRGQEFGISAGSLMERLGGSP